MLWVIGNHSFDYTPNRTSLGPTTIFNYLHETLNFLGVSMLIKISISKFIKGGLIFMLINEFTCLIPQAPLKTWTFMLSLFFITSSLVRYYYAYGLLTILDIGKSCKMVKVLDSMTRSVCIIYNVSSLFILHDANLVLRGSHH